MKNVLHITKREILDWFQTPLSLVFLIGFLGLSHWLFLGQFFLRGEATLRPFFNLLPLFYTVLIPALTMDRWAREKSLGTWEWLQSLPFKAHELYLAKFGTAVVLFTISLLLTLPLVFTITTLGPVDLGPVLASYIGLWLFGVLAITLGLWISSGTNNPVIAYLLHFFILVLWMLVAHESFTQFLPISLAAVFDRISLSSRLEGFWLGLLSLRDVAFLLGLALGFAAFTIRSLKPTRPIGLACLSITLIIASFALPTRHFADLTQDNEHSLSAQTVQITKNLQDRVTVKIYFSKDVPVAVQNLEQKLYDLIASLKRDSHVPIVIQRIDLTKPIEREKAAQIGVEPLRLTVRSQNKEKIQEIYLGLSLHYQDRMDVIPYVTHDQGFEYRLALSLLKLSRNKLPRIGLLLPKTESENNKYHHLHDIAEQLGEIVTLEPHHKNWDASRLDALIIVDPTRAPAHFAVEIDNLLGGGTPVALFASQAHITDNLLQKAKSHGLEKFLKSKGLSLTKRLILDQDQNTLASFNFGGMAAKMPYAFWPKAYPSQLNRKHPVTAQIEELILPWAHAIQIEEFARKNVEVIVATSKESFLQEKDRLTIEPRYPEKMKNLPLVQDYPVMVEVKSQGLPGTLTVGSAPALIQDNFLNESNFTEAFSHQVFTANLIESLTWGNSLIDIRSRGQTTRPLTAISPDEKNQITWLLLGLQVALPLALFLAALLWQKRQTQKLLRNVVSSN